MYAIPDHELLRDEQDQPVEGTDKNTIIPIIPHILPQLLRPNTGHLRFYTLKKYKIKEK